MSTRITPACQGSFATLAMLNFDSTMMFVGIVSRIVNMMPTTPATKPTMSVSALKTQRMSRLLAPMERRMPISFLRSKTEM